MQIRRVSTRYLISEDSSARWDFKPSGHPNLDIENDNIIWKAAEDLGFTSSQFTDLFANASIAMMDVADKWNIYRRAIQKMEWVGAVSPGYKNPMAKSGEGSSWAAARDDYLADAETEVDPTNARVLISTEESGGTFFVNGQRAEINGTINIPAISMFSDYDLRIFRRTALSDTSNFAGKVTHTWGSTQAEGTTPATSNTEFLMEKTGITQTGDITGEMRFAAYANSGELDLWEPDSGTVNASNISAPASNVFLANGFFLKPAFSYGEDPP